jgi:hypothetical protein
MEGEDGKGRRSVYTFEKFDDLETAMGEWQGI